MDGTDEPPLRQTSPEDSKEEEEDEEEKKEEEKGDDRLSLSESASAVDRAATVQNQSPKVFMVVMFLLCTD